MFGFVYLMWFWNPKNVSCSSLNGSVLNMQLKNLCTPIAKTEYGCTTLVLNTNYNCIFLSFLKAYFNVISVMDIRALVT